MRFGFAQAALIFLMGHIVFFAVAAMILVAGS